MSNFNMVSISNPHPHPHPHPHGHSRRIGPLLVCFIPFDYFFLAILFMLWPSFSSFPVASCQQEIVLTTNSTTSIITTSTTATISPAPSLFNSTTSTTNTTTSTHMPVDFGVAIAIGASLSALFIATLSLMAFFTCFRFIKLSRRRKHNLERVASITTVPEQQQEEKAVGVKTAASLVRRFIWYEMERFTSNFSSVIGSGGFSTVYLAQFPDSTLGAVKIHSGSERLNRLFKQELEILVGLQHDHIVKLLGYCDDREQGVLVFEYVPNGNLQEKLHGGRQGAILSWKSRMVIAFQLAQALEYLHDKCPLQIVHGDIKASNILLDQQVNCKLCDFGSAKMGFSSTVLPPSSSPYSSYAMNKMMLGSPGYTDPHYLRTGMASKKNDVYSFGVIVLELITGMEALCSHSGERLTSIAAPMLSDASKVAEMVDARLLQDKFGGGGFDLEEVKAMASISAMCLCDSPTLRPSASDIVIVMRSKIPSSVSFSFSTDHKL